MCEPKGGLVYDKAKTIGCRKQAWPLTRGFQNLYISLAKICKGADSLANGEASTGSLLLGHLESGLIGLSNLTLLFGNVELNVTVGAEVGGDATVSTIGTTTALDGALDNGMSDHTLVGIESLNFGVGLNVDEELTDSLHRLFGPATTNSLEFLALGVALGVVATERNNLLVLKDVLHIVDGLLNHHALDGASDIVSVLIMGTEVSNLAGSGFSGLYGAF